MKKLTKEKCFHTTAIKYFTRLNMFKTNNLKFNPMTMTAHSYEWYEIAKIINGKLVLNTYRYSISTCKHIGKLRSLFRQLELKYTSIDAPQGLQNLDSAFKHALFLHGQAVVKNKYSIGKFKWSDSLHDIKLLESFGCKKVTKKQIKQAIDQAEVNRRHNLDQAKKRRIERIERQKQFELQQKTHLTLV